MPVQDRVITYSDAGVEALREEMRRDDTIVYIGQGIGPRGGNFRQTKGLWERFGDHRLRDTGICELGETGIGIGAAMLIFRSIDLSLYLPNFISFVPTKETLAAAFVLSILVGLISVIYSAYRVSGLTIAEALRSTE